MLDPPILSSVHALETPFPAGSEITCGNPLCSASFNLAGSLSAQSDSVAIRVSSKHPLLRRAAKLLEALLDEQAIEILRRMR